MVLFPSLINTNKLRGRADDLSFFDYSSPFSFLVIEFHCTFFIYLLKYHFSLLILYFD